MADSDCVVIMGNNMAETHPVGFRFVMAAKQRGAQVIHVDPRFTRTSALADQHVALRAGSDLVFLGALVRYVLESDRWNTDPFFKEYVGAYTNAPVLLDPMFRDTEDLGGLFSGFDSGAGRYNTDTWQYAGTRTAQGGAHHPHQDAQTREGGATTGHPQASTLDPTMQDPNCVLQVLRRHFARYTPELVESACGVPREVFLRVASTILESSGRDRTTSFAYAVAWTQHTTGSQIIGCCAILQLLLGNIGRPGGGILALRGHATIQGSTDIPTLYNLLPGYMPMPTLPGHTSLATYLEAERLETGLWYHLHDYLISLLKAWYGDAATAANDFAFDLVPKIEGDYSFEAMVPMMADRTLKGLFCMGQNPAVGGQNTVLARKALGKLDWLVVRDVHEIESASFWYDAPEVRRGEVRPQDIATEIFFLPAALSPEKDGSYTNTQRLMQFHDKAVEPPGDCRSEAWFMYHLGRRLRELYSAETGAPARQLRSITWAYPTRGATNDPDIDRIVKEINGYRVADGAPVPHYSALRADGSTACGCWIYSGVMTTEGENRARRRGTKTVASDGHTPPAQDWGFAWPSNIRLLYNRASADPEGKPWSERKKWLWWDAERGEWTGYDEPDFPRTKSPDYQPPPGARGLDAHSGTAAFGRLADGRGALFTPGMRDGPLPTHYEPWESPVSNALYPRQPRNPLVETFDRPDNAYHRTPDARFPYVLTTYRLTEHHTAGGMSRWLPWLAELQPAAFVEISPELADSLHIEHADWVTVWTLRGQIEARAMVTERLQPLRVNGATVHQVGMPWHFGYGGLARGSIANDLSALIEEPNSRIHEAKSFTCNLRKGRLTSRSEALT